MRRQCDQEIDPKTECVVSVCAPQINKTHELPVFQNEGKPDATTSSFYWCVIFHTLRTHPSDFMA